MAKIRVTIIYIFTTMISLSVCLSLIIILYKNITNYVNTFLILSHENIFEKSMIISCLIIILYQNIMLMKGMYRIWRESLQFGDFIKKAKQQQESLLKK